MDVQSEARSLLSAWLRHEEEAADLRSVATSALRSEGYSEAPKMNLAKEDAKWNAYKTVENRLRAVRLDVGSSGSSALAEDVDVALRLLAQRRREQCEAKAMARAPRAPTRSVPAGSDPALRMEVRHQAREAARQRASKAGRAAAGGARRSGRSASSASALETAAAATPQVVATELQGMRQRVVSESGRLDEEVERTRQEVAREAQAMRELRQAEGERDRKTKVLEQLSNQLQQVQEEKASVSHGCRQEAVTAMVMALEALWHRWRRSAWQLTLRRWREALRALQRKGQRIAVAKKISLLSSCLLLWREVVTSLVAEREAVKHVEELQRFHQRSVLAVSFCQLRCVRRAWVAWGLHVREVQGEKSAATLAAKTSAFLASLPSTDAAPAEETPSPTLMDCVEVEAETSAPVPRRSRSCPKVLMEIEKRAEERRKSQEERSKQRKLKQDAKQELPLPGPSSPHGADVVTPQGDSTEAAEGGGSSAAPRAPKPKALVEMEKRAVQRREAHELRRQCTQQKEEEEKRRRLAEEEQKQKEAEEVAKRERLQAQRERRREEQRIKAQKLVAQALRRDKERSARELYILHRYIRVWCGLRQEVSQAHFLDVMAFNRRGQRLLRFCFAAWLRCRLKRRSARFAARLGRAHLALSWLARRHAFRCIVAVLRIFLRQQRRVERDCWTLVGQSQLRTGFSLWMFAAEESARQKRFAALQHYAKHLLRICVRGWKGALQELRLEDALEMHKRALRQKVSGWLQEMEEFSDRKDLASVCADYLNLPLATQVASAKKSGGVM